jgi:hypothetical protein
MCASTLFGNDRERMRDISKEIFINWPLAASLCGKPVCTPARHLVAAPACGGAVIDPARMPLMWAR